MSTVLTINPDQTVKAEWKGKKGCGSLFQTMASGNANDVNKLNLEEIAAVFTCVVTAPFPCGNGVNIYRKILEGITGKTSVAGVKNLEKLASFGLGECRKQLILQAGDGCNAPTDSYLRIAIGIKENKDYIESY